MLFLALVAPHLALAAPAYIRFPDIHGDTVVFAAGGDLWTANVVGGAPARRLTAADGTERYPRFSPDGATIAYTGEYDGNSDVFVIPATGGEPRRLTYGADDDIVLGWSPDGTQVYFRSRRTDPNTSWRIYSVPVAAGGVTAGAEPTELPLGWAGWLDVDPDSGKYAFTRTGFESRTWKRYRGGTADDIWAGDPKQGTYARLTTFEGADSYPMWNGGKIYFLSDEGGTGKLFRMDADGKNRTPLTTNTDWDIRWPAMGPGGRIVYGLGGDLWEYDIPADGSIGQSKKLDINVPSEAVLTREVFREAASALEWWDLSPDGDRVLVESRGELWSVPAKEGVSLPITHDSAARERFGTFSADGKSVLYITDVTHEEAIARRDAYGRGDEKTVVPAGATGWHFAPVESGDGKWVAYSDQTQTLYVAPAGGGPGKAIDRSTQAEIRDYAWSKDGRWLAYSKLDGRGYSAVYVYDSHDASVHQVTPSTLVAYGPAWDPDGRYLYVMGDNHVDPLLSARDFDYVAINATLPYAILLRADVKNPFVPADGLPDDGSDNDEKDATAGKKGAKAADKKGAKKAEKDGKDDGDTDDKKPKPFEITFDGMADRMAPFPVQAAIYGDLSANSEGVYYLSSPIQGMADSPDSEDDAPQCKSSLIRFDLAKRKPETFLSGIGDYRLAGKGEKVAVLTAPGAISVLDAGAVPAAPPGPDAAVNLEDVVIRLDPREEWTQIYYEAWRNMRDFHWDPKMAGVDWQKMRDQYAKLLPRLTSRAELTDLLGELIGELANSHTYVGGGDPGKGPDLYPTGNLGADFTRDGTAFKITRIYHGDPADNDVNPLLVPGVGVQEGDFILQIDHQTPAADKPIEAALAWKAGTRVVLTVNSKNSTTGARDVIVTPRGDDHSLRYHDWVRKNREYVADKSGGKLGYIHIPDMGVGGLIAFDTWFAPQLDKQGLVIDCRWNRGGFVSQLLIERLERKLVGFDRARNGGTDTYPSHVLNGQLVVLTNQFAGSDGDIFPYSVQRLGLAPVIGERSWGGVVGIRGDKPMVDGGYLTQPEYANWWPGTGWAVENHGVDPDMVVENMPQDVAAGRDPQLDAAIAQLQKEVLAKPPVKPDFGPEPKKTRQDFEK